MIINNVRLSLRHLSRQKLNTALHIVGLTLGMSVCLLIGLFLRYELSFDTYHTRANRIYRINLVVTNGDEKIYHYSTPVPLAEALRSDVAGLENVSLAHPASGIVEITPEKRFMQEHILIVEPEFLHIFDINVLRGNGDQALRLPYHALVTETTAKKFFGNEDPIGKTFKYKNEFIITISGLIQDPPSNTHLPASMLMSYVPESPFLGSGSNAWTYVSGTSTFVVLPEKHDTKNLATQLKRIADKNINSNPGRPKFFRKDFEIQPLSRIHFDSKYQGGGVWIKAVNTSWLWFFAGIGLAVLALACINFVNLSTAQALTRAKEVGIRKVAGAGKANLIMQFLGEAWMLALFSGILSVVITQSFLPSVNTLLDRQIIFNPMESPRLLITIFSGIFITGLLAGIYPAWIIAKFNPAAALKTGLKMTVGNRDSTMRKGLVVIQFTISAGLFIAVLLMAQQIKYMRSKDLGFDKDNIINVRIGSPDKVQFFASQLSQIPQVKEFSFATAAPSTESHWGTMMSFSDGNDINRQGVTTIMADDHFCQMYDLKLLRGRLPQASDTNYISRSQPKEKQIIKVVVNEELVKVMGWDANETALDKIFWCGVNDSDAEIVGVIADFNTNSLREAVKPTLITYYPKFFGEAGIKIESGADIPQTIAAIEAAWKNAYPEGIFDFKFLDDRIDSFYKAETRLYTLFKIFAGLAMLISCLGLWGLATYAARQRTKEIGIRKVLGASVNAIVLLLSKDFLLTVLTSLAIASPLVYYFMKGWLQNFAYRIHIGWEVFAIAGAVSVMIALITVSVQTLKVALANPVDSLRNE